MAALVASAAPLINTGKAEPCAKDVWTSVDIFSNWPCTVALGSKLAIDSCAATAGAVTVPCTPVIVGACPATVLAAYTPAVGVAAPDTTWVDPGPTAVIAGAVDAVGVAADNAPCTPPVVKVSPVCIDCVTGVTAPPVGNDGLVNKLSTRDITLRLVPCSVVVGWSAPSTRVWLLGASV